MVRVLLGDDDSDESYLFNEAIEHAGFNFQLSRVNDGNELLKYLNTNPLPDIVFVDINMPYKDGLEALAEIRSKREFDKLPLVIYSTTKNEVSIDLCYKGGADLFVVKPNNFDGMVEVLTKVFSINWSNYQRVSRKEFVIALNED